MNVVDLTLDLLYLEKEINTVLIKLSEWTVTTDEDSDAVRQDIEKLLSRIEGIATTLNLT